jgi:drug/metabolite transporter, DME family
MRQVLGFLFVLLAGIGFGFLGIFGRLAFQSGLNVGELLTYRFIIAGLILLVGLAVIKPRLIFLSKKSLLTSVLLGLFGYAVFSTLYFKSIEGISVALAALLLFTFPLFVNLGAHFILKERMSKLQVLSLGLACVGLAVLLWGPIVVNSLEAVLYALTAAITYSAYVLISGHYQKDVHPLSSSFYVIVSAAAALLVFHQPSLPKFFALSISQQLLILGIAIVSTIAPLTLFLAGLQRLSSAKASVVVMIEPVVAAIAAWFILDEKLTATQLAGALLVVVALVINALSPSENKHRN